MQHQTRRAGPATGLQKLKHTGGPAQAGSALLYTNATSMRKRNARRTEESGELDCTHKRAVSTVCSIIEFPPSKEANRMPTTAHRAEILNDILLQQKHMSAAYTTYVNEASCPIWQPAHPEPADIFTSSIRSLIPCAKRACIGPKTPHQRVQRPTAVPSRCASRCNTEPYKPAYKPAPGGFFAARGAISSCEIDIGHNRGRIDDIYV